MRGRSRPRRYRETGPRHRGDLRRPRPCEVQVTAIRLRLAGERFLEVRVSLRSLEVSHGRVRTTKYAGSLRGLARRRRRGTRASRRPCRPRASERPRAGRAECRSRRSRTRSGARPRRRQIRRARRTLSSVPVFARTRPRAALLLQRFASVPSTPPTGSDATRIGPDPEVAICGAEQRHELARRDLARVVEARAVVGAIAAGRDAELREKSRDRGLAVGPGRRARRRARLGAERLQQRSRRRSCRSACSSRGSRARAARCRARRRASRPAVPRRARSCLRASLTPFAASAARKHLGREPHRIVDALAHVVAARRDLDLAGDLDLEPATLGLDVDLEPRALVGDRLDVGLAERARSRARRDRARRCRAPPGSGSTVTVNALLPTPRLATGARNPARSFGCSAKCGGSTSPSK